ncbi:hypothetical protein NCCNTM_46870 [Mycolicibacterium sp. NCC-Tsukiji]|nr:hypothetical protein NCCNTM_46870 [Mycolicibacterium sp. NCC-Tsukiji]
MTYAVREFATVALSDEPARAEMQLNHLVRLIGERKLFMLVFELPENYETSDYVEPADNFVQTTGTRAGLIHPGVSGEFFFWEGWVHGCRDVETAVSGGIEGAGCADGGRSAQ